MIASGDSNVNCTEGSKIQSNETPQPFLTDDFDTNDEKTEYCNGASTTHGVNTSAKQIFVLEDVLVKAANITNSTPQEPQPKPKICRIYNPTVRRARYQATRIKFLAKKLRDTEKLKKSRILDYLERNLKENQMIFVRMQVNNAGKSPRGHRFTFDEKCFAFALYKQSPKAYSWLKQIVKLPSKQTSMEHSAFVRFEAGINPTLMTFLSDYVKNMSETDKVVTLGWDEMALNAHLDFCKVKDYLDGFVDYGTKTKDEFATHALVFMVRGVQKSFKQPISYFLTQNINKSELAALIKLVIEAVMDVGLKVIGSVCDAVGTNVAAIKALMQPMSSRLPRSSLKYLEYRVRDTAIIHYFDPPHLIKTIRNNMLTKDLYHYVATKTNTGKTTEKISWDNQNKVEKKASWDHVKEFYTSTEGGINRLLENITPEHIEPKKKKMKVNVAVQVFSRTFGTTMRFYSEKKQFNGTADILIFFNEVFDSLNGGGLPSAKDSLKGSIHVQSYHFTFWKYAVNMIQRMRFVPKDPETQDRSRVLNDYVMTINGIVELTRRLFDLKIENVSLRNMTQDALENFFGGIRSYCRAAVCPRNFRCAYATSLFNGLTSHHSIKSNCEEDGGIPLIRNLFSIFSMVERSDHAVEEGNVDDADDNNASNFISNRKKSKVENEVGNYFAAQVCKKVLKSNECADCEKSISSRGKNESFHGLINARSQNLSADNQLQIVYPKPRFIEKFKKLTSELEQSIRFHCFHKPLRKTIMQGTSEVFVIRVFREIVLCYLACLRTITGCCVCKRY